ncbi:biopolymer transporter ExbD [SAR86 cluster bacterium]|jgi:biopolymer transport protein ExbD|nr:biopolymer transporter ExbD [SAR86 cluster bacterium]
MKFLRKKNSEISLEVTPLIDIVFLLLIFFILNSQFEKLTSLELNLPKVNSEQLDEINGKNLVIEITAIEEIILNGQKLSEITFNSLNNYIKENFSQFSSAVISADSNTKYKYLVTIMDVLNRNNFETVEINATELR